MCFDSSRQVGTSDKVKWQLTFCILLTYRPLDRHTHETIPRPEQNESLRFRTGRSDERPCMTSNLLERDTRVEQEVAPPHTWSHRPVFGSVGAESHLLWCVRCLLLLMLSPFCLSAGPFRTVSDPTPILLAQGCV